MSSLVAHAVTVPGDWGLLASASHALHSTALCFAEIETDMAISAESTKSLKAPGRLCNPRLMVLLSTIEGAG